MESLSFLKPKVGTVLFTLLLFSSFHILPTIFLGVREIYGYQSLSEIPIYPAPMITSGLEKLPSEAEAVSVFQGVCRYNNRGYDCGSVTRFYINWYNFFYLFLYYAFSAVFYPTIIKSAWKKFWRNIGKTIVGEELE